VSVFSFRADKKQADEYWGQDVPERIEDLGEVDSLSILPLIDWCVDRNDLVGEAGVSYLVRTDDHGLLFDLGLNWKREDPSPLLRNMSALGLGRDDFEAIVISHRHLDHTGGLAAQRGKTFYLSPGAYDLAGITAYVPVPMSHPTATVEVTRKPKVIFPGVTTTGAIPRALWLFGLTWEQAVAVNVRGKGIVLIVGCGHQSLSRLLERSRSLFAQPFYGLVGGLHYPVTASRTPWVFSQRRIGTGKLPWRVIHPEEVEAAIAELALCEPHLVAISAHDSCDWTIRRFREAFGDRYRDVVVGREIVV
jgi:7,8-dihydropterin-6-yl-methyl-4-(beta-D-ribofuranosyl)aminobenzene 5'-phosphate synthase